jgi:hypothetical protein
MVVVKIGIPTLSSKVDLRLTQDAMAILTNNDQDKSHIS